MRRVPLALLLLCLLAAPATAKDTRDTTAAVLDGLAAPSEAGRWEFSGYVLRDGRPYGKVSLSAGPHPDAPGNWLARDEITPRRTQDFAVLQTAVLDRRLQASAGRFHRRNTQGFLKARFTAAKRGYFVEHEADYYENHLDVACPRGIATLAGVITFLRAAPLDAAVYRLWDFDPDPSAGDGYALRARLQVHGLAGWIVGAKMRAVAWIVSYERGKQTLRLAFDPETRALLGVEYVGLGIQLVPAGSAPGRLTNPTSKLLATPIELAVARTAAVRAGLGVPLKPLTFRGVIAHGGFEVGTVTFEAQPASRDGLPAWRVLESRTIRVGEARIEHELTGFLGQDLGVARGERIDARPEGRFHVTYERKAGGMETIEHGDAGASKPVLLGAPAGAMAGLVPVVLFLRSVPAKEAHYVLPGWDPRSAQKPKAGTGTFSLSRSDLHIAVTLAEAGLIARCERRNGQSFEVVLERASRRVRVVRGILPTLHLFTGRDVATSKLKQVTWYDAVDGAPATWRQAFVKFGRGYHLPRRELLMDAFHWPSMVKQGIAEKRYTADTPVERIQKDWIDVFVSMSKHRTEGDCDDLLFQIFMTSEVTQHEDGDVSLRTLPAYGGHTYRMAKVGTRWWIVKID